MFSALLNAFNIHHNDGTIHQSEVRSLFQSKQPFGVLFGEGGDGLGAGVAE